MRLLSALVLFMLGGCANGTWRGTVDNDLFSPTGDDRNYTSGVALEYSPDETSTYEVGQKIYTPENLSASERITDDRSYAGYIWAGYARHRVSLCRTGGAIREETGFRVGAVGAPSLASETQKFFHNSLLSDAVSPKGWRHQIETEVTVGAHHERKKSLFRFGHGQWRGDAIGIVRADLGTDITRARVGGMLRYGLRLPDVFGGERPGCQAFRPDPTSSGLQKPIDPWLDTFGSASDNASLVDRASYLGPPWAQGSPLRAHLSLEANAHVTAYNILIDNHLFRRGTDLSLEPLGYDFSAGLFFEWGNYTVGYRHTTRSAEFVGDRSSSFGSIVVGWSFKN